MRLITLRPRERRLGLSVVLIISCWALLSLLVEPLWDRAGELRQHLSAQSEKLDAFNRLLEQSPNIERQHRRIAGYLSSERDVVGQGTFLNELEAVSRRTHVQLSLKPRPVKEDARFRRLEVELDVEGTQSDLLAFLDVLLARPELLAIDQLRISSVPTKEELVRARLVVQKLTLL